MWTNMHDHLKKKKKHCSKSLVMIKAGSVQNKNKKSLFKVK